MNKLLKEYICTRCGRKFRSYMSYKPNDKKICGKAGCWEDRNLYKLKK